MADVSLNPTAWTDPRLALANQLIQGSSDTSPVRSWTQELARALSGPVGAYEATKLRDDRTQALNDIYNPGASAQLAQQQPGLFARIGNNISGMFGGGDSTAAQNATPASQSAVAGSPQMTAGAPSPSAAPPQAAQPASAPTPTLGAAIPASTGATVAQPTAATPSSLMQLQYQAQRMMQVGRERNQPDLVQQGASILQNLQMKQAEAQIAAGGKLLENGKVLMPDNTVTALGGFGQIDAQNKALTDQAENAPLIARTAGISHAERGDKIAEALAPEQFKLQTGTAPVQTPNGPTLMTNQQAMEYARSGGGALQDPKIHDAQVAEITDSQKRLVDANTRLQNLSQLKSIFANPNLITGAQGDQIQTIRSTLLQGYKALGKEPPKELVQGVGSAEALGSAANSLALEVSRDEAGSVPRISIFNAISANKPGLGTSPQGNLVRVLAMEQAAKRESDFGNFAPDYYRQHGNYNKQDAEAAFAKLHPNDQYVSQIYPKTPEQRDAIPSGQYYIAPDGSVKVRP